MADAPRPQRTRRRRGMRAGPSSAAPTADATPSGVNGQGRRRRRRFRRRRGAPMPLLTQNPRVTTRKYVKDAIKRELKREGLEGPRVAVQQKITSTFGLIGPNTSGNAELELNFFCHPSLAKEANDGTAFGPLQALAAQYALWKIKYLTLRFTPMVGASAVSGTVIRASLNLSQSPGGSNWSGLGTRIHLDMHPGQTATFHLRGDQVGGPRDGGWWFTDTNEEGSQSAGPIVEVHTLGKTKSTFKNADWDGPLFLVEGIGLWQFANYQVKPALGQLERREAEVSAKLTGEAGQPITLELPNNSEVALFMDSLEPESADADMRSVTSNSVGETIFQIVDIGAQLAQQIVPPPFGWLIRGGWWFVKKLIGRARAGTSMYAVYASLSDAQNNKPAIATSSAIGNAVNTKMLVTQINSPNVGPNPTIPTTRAAKQTLRPGTSFRVHAQMISECMIEMSKRDDSNLVQIPVSAIPGVQRKADGSVVDQNTALSPADTQTNFIQTPWWIGLPGRSPSVIGSTDPNYVPSENTGGYVHTLYRLIDPEFTDPSGDIEYYPPEPETDIVFSALNGFNTTGTVSSANPYAGYGKVVATSLIQSFTVPPIAMTVNLIKTYNSVKMAEDSVRDMMVVDPDTVGQAHIMTLPYTKGDGATSTNKKWTILERTIPTDQYLLGISYTQAPVNIHGVNIPTTLTKGVFPRTESPQAAIFPYNLSGMLFPGTSVDLRLVFVRSPKLNDDLVEQLRALRVPFTEPEKPFSVAEWWNEHEPSDDEDETETDTDSEPHSSDSERNFWLEVGGECIMPPRRWSHLFDKNGRLRSQYSQVDDP